MNTAFGVHVLTPVVINHTSQPFYMPPFWNREFYNRETPPPFMWTTGLSDVYVRVDGEVDLRTPKKFRIKTPGDGVHGFVVEQDRDDMPGQVEFFLSGYEERDAYLRPPFIGYDGMGEPLMEHRYIMGRKVVQAAPILRDRSDYLLRFSAEMRDDPRPRVSFGRDHRIPPWGEAMSRFMMQPRPLWIAGERAPFIDELVTPLWLAVSEHGYLPGISITHITELEGEPPAISCVVEMKSSYLRRAIDPSFPLVMGGLILSSLNDAGRLVVLPGGAIDLTSHEFYRSVAQTGEHKLASVRSDQNPSGAFTPGVHRFLEWERRVPHYLGVITQVFPDDMEFERVDLTR